MSKVKRLTPLERERLESRINQLPLKEQRLISDLVESLWASNFQVLHMEGFLKREGYSQIVHH